MWGNDKNKHYLLPRKARDNLKHGPRIALMKLRAARPKKWKDY